MLEFPLFPPAASTLAGSVDALFLFLVTVCGLMSIAIFAAILLFAIRYRAGREVDRTNPSHGSLKLEIAWSAAPLAVFLVIFAWGVQIYYRGFHPPPGSIPIYVVGKQWMWKVQHPEGKREINQLHVPVGQPVRLVLTSEDVIHDFYVPAFRVKRDAIPGRYTSLWFEATRTGTFHLFCAEYCGADHAGMRGQVVVMEPRAYQAWLATGTAGETMESAGARLFERYNCATCHRAGGRGPDLAGLYGREVELADGRRVLADEAYLRESILAPAARITAGWDPVMPTYQGQLDEMQVLELVAHMKTLGERDAP